MSEIKCPRCKKTYIAIDDEETLFGPAIISCGFTKDVHTQNYICNVCGYKVTAYEVWKKCENL